MRRGKEYGCGEKYNVERGSNIIFPKILDGEDEKGSGIVGERNQEFFKCGWGSCRELYTPLVFSDQADTVLGLLDSFLKTRSSDLADYSVEDEQVGMAGSSQNITGPK